MSVYVPAGRDTCRKRAKNIGLPLRLIKQGAMKAIGDGATAVHIANVPARWRTQSRSGLCEDDESVLTIPLVEQPQFPPSPGL